MKRRLTSRHRSRVLAAYRRKASIAAAAHAAGVSRTAAYLILDEAGIVARTPVYPASLVLEAERLYVEQRLSCRAVAATLAETYDPAPSDQWVSDHLRRRGVIRSRSEADRAMNARLTGKDYDRLEAQARELAEERRLSVRAIARELGVSRNMVRAALAPKDRCGPSKAMSRRRWEADLPDVERRLDRRASVVYWRRQGLTYDQIAARTGLSWSTIYQYLKAAGLTRPLGAARPARRRGNFAGREKL